MSNRQLKLTGIAYQNGITVTFSDDMTQGLKPDVQFTLSRSAALCTAEWLLEYALQNSSDMTFRRKIEYFEKESYREFVIQLIIEYFSQQLQSEKRK